MKFVKWIIGLLVVILIIILFFAVWYHFKNRETTTPIWEIEEFQNVKLDQIVDINIVSYTEGGSESVLEEDEDSIQKTYRYLSKIRVGKETTYACEDNTKIYFIHLKSGEEVPIEIECDWIIIQGKRYMIKK